MKIYHFVDGYFAHRFKSRLFGGSNFSCIVPQHTFFPVLLLDEVFPELLAARTPEFDIDVTRTELPDIVTLLHHVSRKDPLSAIAFDRSLHSDAHLRAAGLGVSGERPVRRGMYQERGW